MGRRARRKKMDTEEPLCLLAFPSDSTYTVQTTLEVKKSTTDTSVGTHFDYPWPNKKTGGHTKIPALIINKGTKRLRLGIVT